jgi:exosome complex component RRP46
LPVSNSSIFVNFVGGSCCVASVNGPMEVPIGNLDINKAYVDVIYRPKSGLPSVNERYKEKIVKSLCETVIATHLFPRTQITAQVQELDDHGGVSLNLIYCLTLILN